MPKNARAVFSRKANKAGGGELGRDSGKRRVPGLLGRSNIKTVDARKGYTEGENRFGPGGRGRAISLPTKSAG